MDDKKTSKKEHRFFIVKNVTILRVENQILFVMFLSAKHKMDDKWVTKKRAKRAQKNRKFF